MLDINVYNEIVYCDLNNPGLIVKSNLSYCLCRFLTEIKRVEGTEYPLGSVKSLIYGIQMHLATKRL